MPRFLVDVNLPYYFSLWKDGDYIHQSDIDESWSDKQIWDYGLANKLIIISKDADFYHAILTTTPPPKVIHLRIGNMRIGQLHDFLNKVWPEVLNLVDTCKLVTVYSDRIEGMEDLSQRA